jgi:hypothetical protein
MKKSTKTKPTKSSQYSDIKTFTYFIAAPPKRKTGYREREFDKIMHGILSEGHVVLDWKMQSVSDGVYVIFMLKGTKKENHGAGLDLHEKYGLADRHSDSSLELLDDEN